MPLSKSPAEDKNLQDRVMGTIDGPQHTLNPKYYELIDQAWNHLTTAKTEFDRNDIENHLESHPKDINNSIPLKTFPALQKHEHQSQQDFYNNVVSKLPEEDQYLGHQAWADVTNGSKPRIVKTSSYPVNKFSFLYVPDENLPVKTEDHEKIGKMPFEEVLQSYKKASNHPTAMAWQFIVDRLLHLSEYEAATPDQRSQKHEAWREQGDYSNKSKKTSSMAYMRRHLVENPNWISDALFHQRSMHDFLTTHFKHALHDIEGIPHVALSRGLHDENHGVDRTLASYANSAETGFGDHDHQYLVPLEHTWYSYDIGPESALTPDLNTETEFVVDNQHPRVKPPVSTDPWKTIPRNIHNYDLSDTSTWPKSDQKKALQAAFRHDDVPEWAGRLDPTMIKNSLPTYLTPELRKNLSSLGFSKEQWLSMNSPPGMEMAVKIGATAEDFQSVLASPLNYQTTQWLIHRYPFPFTREQQVLMAQNVDPTSAYDLSQRPEMAADIKDYLLKKDDINIGSAKFVYKDGWSSDSLWGKK